MTGEANPLVAERHDSTQWFTGFAIAEDISDIVSGVQSGSWIDDTIGGVATAMDTLSVVVDPLGSLVSWGVSWLMEHVKPLSDALDHLAGDPDQITAYAQTWHNVSDNANQAGSDLRTAYFQQVSNWTGPAGDAYQSHASNHLSTLSSISKAAGGIGMIVEGAGLLVALVRGIVRDLIADFVSVLAVRLPEWLAEIGLTLGFGTPWVISQVASLVGKWVSRITNFLHALINSFRRLKPIMHKLGDLIEELRTVLRKLGKHDPLDPNGPHARDMDGDGTPDGLDPDGNGDGKLDDFNGDGRPDIPPAITDGPTLNTTPRNPQYRYENDPERSFFRDMVPGSSVHYMDDAEREAHRIFQGPDGLLYRSDGTLFDTSSGASVHAGGGGRAIFVMDEHGNMYASNHQQVGYFHHSTFLGGENVASAGELQVTNGQVNLVTDHSGHYQPGRSYTQQVVNRLQAGGAGDFHVDYWAPEGS
jgi:hypothetical protein